MEVWESNSFLVSIAQMLRITMSYGYYTKPQVYSVFDYNGPMVPDLPPWYKPGTVGRRPRPDDNPGEGRDSLGDRDAPTSAS